MKKFLTILVICIFCLCFLGCEEHTDEAHCYIEYEIIDYISYANSEIDAYEIQLELVETKEELIEVATIWDYRKYPDKTATYTLFIADKYDDAFFEENVMVLLYLYLPTPASESELDSIELKDDILVVNTIYISPKEQALQVEAGWWIYVIKIKKSDIQGVTEAKEYRTNKYN